MVCNWVFQTTCTWVCSHGSMAKWWEVTGITWKKNKFKRTPRPKGTGNKTKLCGPKRNSRHEVHIHIVLPLDTIMWRPQSWPTTTCQAANTGRHRGCFSFLNAKHHQHKAAVWQSYGSFQVLSNYGNWVAATKPCYTRRILLYNCLLKMFVLQFGSPTPCKTIGGHRVWSLLNFTDCHAHPYG